MSELVTVPSPGAYFEAEVAAAETLGRIIEDRKLYTLIRGRGGERSRHIRIEGWTLLASWRGWYADIESTHEIPDGYKARARARNLDGRVAGAVDAICTRTESRGHWRYADEYALLSMAQTRAAAKCLRLPLGYLVVLAGYDATPAEEMPEPATPKPKPKRGRAASAEAPLGSKSDELRRSLYAMAEARGIGSAALSDIAREAGVSGEPATLAQLAAIGHLLQQYPVLEPELEPAARADGSTDGE